MYIQYNGEIEDEIFIEIIEKVLKRFGLEEIQKQISREIVLKLEDFFIDGIF